jgi:teichuronic acid biosynthesis glycosyltransferase TuaG
LYNGIEFLDECLKSIISQTYNKYEVIIGINGHPINSIIQKKAIQLSKNYNTIHVIWYPTKGKELTLNAMIKDTKFDYICILDVDDKWFPTKLEEQIKYIDKYDVIGTQCQYFGQKNNIPKIPLNDISNFDFFQVNPIINSSVLIKKCDANWESLFYGLDDYHLWMKLRYIKNRTFFNIPKILTYHRVYSNSSFNGKQDIITFKKFWKNKI